jgi:hypothetical protein
MSLLFFFLLLFLPFKFFLPLLGLGSLLPVFSGFFACILAVATCYIKDKHELFSFIQLLYTFVIACSLCYFFNVLGQSEYLYILFGFIPMLAECGMNETFYSPGRLALFSEGNKSPSPPSNYPLPGFNSSSSSSRSVSPTPAPSLSFEQQLWLNRFRSLEDARRLDIAKRILLNKIIASKQNVPYEIQQCIQDNIWGNHWYDVYRSQHRALSQPPYFI